MIQVSKCIEYCEDFAHPVIFNVLKLFSKIIFQLDIHQETDIITWLLIKYNNILM